jgi:hypothetical protein
MDLEATSILSSDLYKLVYMRLNWPSLPWKCFELHAITSAEAENNIDPRETFEMDLALV